MRVVIQRASKATVTIEHNESREIGVGLVVLLGIVDDDTSADIEWLCAKISRLRIFDDAQGVMNCSIQDIDGEMMIVSQFTLHASTKKGNRPSYIRAARSEVAIPLYNEFIDSMQRVLPKEIVTGEFGAHMDVMLVNDGPVTIIIDSKNRE